MKKWLRINCTCFLKLHHLSPNFLIFWFWKSSKTKSNSGLKVTNEVSTQVGAAATLASRAVPHPMLRGTALLFDGVAAISTLSLVALESENGWTTLLNEVNGAIIGFITPNGVLEAISTPIIKETIEVQNNE